VAIAPPSGVLISGVAVDDVVISAVAEAVFIDDVVLLVGMRSTPIVEDVVNFAAERVLLMSGKRSSPVAIDLAFLSFLSTRSRVIVRATS